MGDKVLVVRSDELAKQSSRQRFKALPEEELLRHHASVEVLALDRDQAERDETCRQLVICTTLHHNYSRLTHVPERARSPGQRSLLVSERAIAGDRAPLFLDDEFANGAARAVDAAVMVPGGYSLRLAGWIDDDSSEFGRRHLGLLYVARLRRPGVIPREGMLSEVAFRGPEDLRSERERFEPWSQILIDHLDAL